MSGLFVSGGISVRRVLQQAVHICISTDDTERGCPEWRRPGHVWTTIVFCVHSSRLLWHFRGQRQLFGCKQYEQRIRTLNKCRDILKHSWTLVSSAARRRTLNKKTCLLFIFPPPPCFMNFQFALIRTIHTSNGSTAQLGPWLPRLRLLRFTISFNIQSVCNICLMKILCLL
jgi:hypothetical protein